MLGWPTIARCSIEAAKFAPCSSACSCCATILGLLAEEYDPKAQRKLCNIHMHSLMLCSADRSGADDAGYAPNPASGSLGAEGQC